MVFDLLCFPFVDMNVQDSMTRNVLRKISYCIWMVPYQHEYPL